MTTARLAAFCLGFAERNNARAGRQAERLERVALERENLRATLRWAHEHQDAEVALRVVAAIWPSWFMRQELVEGLSWLKRALRLPRAAEVPACVDALLGVSILGYWHGHQLETELIEECLSAFRARKSLRGVAACLCAFGFAAQLREDFGAAETHYHESLVLFRQIGDIWASAVILNRLWSVAFVRGELGRARALAEESYTLFQQAGDEVGCTVLLNFLGETSRAEGEYAAARERFGESLRLAQGLHDRLRIAGCLEALAGVDAVQGRHQQAARLFGAAEAIRDASGLQRRLHPRATYDQDVELARKALGEAAFGAARAAGRALSQDDAIAEAVAGDAAPSSPPRSPAAIPPTALEPLTAREQEVAVLVAGGLTNREIAEALVIAESTAAVHIKHILGKLDLRSRAQLAAWAVAHGLRYEPPARP